MNVAEEWANLGATDQLAWLDNDDELTLPFIASLMRAAYGQGYINAYAEPEPLTVNQAVRNREMLLLKVPV